MKSKQKIIWKLFTSTLTISAFTFGGGYVIVPLMKKKFVDHYQWIEEEEMLDMVAIAQSSPGAIAVNASILVGYKKAGFTGAFVSLLGTILPPLVIVSIFSVFYQSLKDNPWVRKVLTAMAVGVVAVILDVVLKMLLGLLKEKSIFSLSLLVGSALMIFLLEVDFKWIILVGGILGIIYRWITGRKEEA